MRAKSNIFILFVVLLLQFQIISCREPLDYQIDKKLILIKQILDNPNSAKEILKKSRFFDDSLHNSNTHNNLNRIFWVGTDHIDNIKNNSVLTYEQYDDADYFNFHCYKMISNEKKSLDISFSFEYINNKWVFSGVSHGRFYLVSSAEDLNYYQKKGLTPNNSLPKKNFNYWFNENYQLTEKLNFINKVIDKPSEFQKYLKESKFFNDKIHQSTNKDFAESLEEIFNYFEKYKDSSAVWLNYPFATNDSCITKYFKDDSPKDIFVLRYSGDDGRKSINGYFTFEFIRISNKWYFSKATKGLQDYFILESYQYLEPK